MSPGYCTKVCCDESIEETCFSIFTGEADSCALIIDGGCPCADGEIKCGVTDAYSGYCTSVCCDDLIEETCFSEYTGLAESCALITDGGCPCPYGMKKCGATEAHAGMKLSLTCLSWINSFDRWYCGLLTSFANLVDCAKDIVRACVVATDRNSVTTWMVTSTVQITPAEVVHVGRVKWNVVQMKPILVCFISLFCIFHFTGILKLLQTLMYVGWFKDTALPCVVKKIKRAAGMSLETNIALQPLVVDAEWVLSRTTLQLVLVMQLHTMNRTLEVDTEMTMFWHPLQHLMSRYLQNHSSSPSRLLMHPSLSLRKYTLLQIIDHFRMVENRRRRILGSHHRNQLRPVVTIRWILQVRSHRNQHMGILTKSGTGFSSRSGFGRTNCSDDFFLTESLGWVPLQFSLAK